MAIEDLSQFELFQGILDLISLGITIFVGLKIISKYTNFKRIEFITVGLMMIFISSPWWGCNISFILILFFNTEISDSLYIFISFGLIPLSVLFWLYSFCHLTYPKSKWKIISIWLIISIVYEIFFIIFLFTDPTLLAIRKTRIDSETQPYVSLYSLGSLIISIITNSIFFKKCLKSDNERVQWMGKFILIAFILFMIGAFLDSAISLNPIALLITRIILVASSVLGYIGWTMPDRVAKWLVKE
ncbi:MAG: hypothetical protein ACFFDK_05835 [Promethearchaeota archaeon]